jgi:hypothetical protein
MRIGYYLADTVGIQHQVTIDISGQDGIVGYSNITQYRTGCKNLVKIQVGFVKSGA